MRVAIVIADEVDALDPESVLECLYNIPEEVRGTWGEELYPELTMTDLVWHTGVEEPSRRMMGLGIFVYNMAYSYIEPIIEGVTSTRMVLKMAHMSGDKVEQVVRGTRCYVFLGGLAPVVGILVKAGILSDVSQ